MKMKYFNQLSDMERTLQMLVYVIKRAEEDPSDVNLSIMDAYGVTPSDKNNILEEIDAISYLISCQTMIARRNDQNDVKPSIEVANRAFNRVIEQLSSTHRQEDNGKPVFRTNVAQKEYDACKHYLFQFSLPAWYEKLPSEVLTFNNKWGKDHPDA